MSDTPDPFQPAPPPGNAGRPAAPDPRADRLAAALKANMARRKAQARARSGAPKSPENNTDA